jgi:hypothetical protein
VAHLHVEHCRSIARTVCSPKKDEGTYLYGAQQVAALSGQPFGRLPSSVHVVVLRLASVNRLRRRFDLNAIAYPPSQADFRCLI